MKISLLTCTSDADSPVAPLFVIEPTSAWFSLLQLLDVFTRLPIFDAWWEDGLENIAPGGLSPRRTFAPNMAIFELIEEILFGAASPADDDSLLSFPTSPSFSLAILSAIEDLGAGWSDYSGAAAASMLLVDVASALRWLLCRLSADNDEPAAVMIGAFELLRFAMRSRTDITNWARLYLSTPFPGSWKQILLIKVKICTTQWRQ